MVLFVSTEIVDIIDEAINYFRANVLFRKFEVKSAADKLLIYLTLYINMALKRMEGCKTEADGIKAIISLGLEKFPIPGEAGFPLGGLLTPPKSRVEAGESRVLSRPCKIETLTMGPMYCVVIFRFMKVSFVHITVLASKSTHF